MEYCIHNKPKWKPMYWDNLREQDLKITNCYAYAFNVVEKNLDPNNDHKIQPGDISNSSLENNNCDNILLLGTCCADDWEYSDAKNPWRDEKN